MVTFLELTVFELWGGSHWMKVYTNHHLRVTDECWVQNFLEELEIQKERLLRANVRVMNKGHNAFQKVEGHSILNNCGLNVGGDFWLNFL